MPKENRAKFAMLGFLSLQPMSGYDIKRFAACSVAHFWNEDYGHIYPTLRALEAEGFASKAVEAGKGKPDRNVYTITASGEAALAAWLAQAPQRANLRVELLLKVFFAGRMEAADFRRMLDGEIAACDAAVAELLATEVHLDAAMAAGDGLAVHGKFQKMTLKYGLAYYRTLRAWCVESKEEL